MDGQIYTIDLFLHFMARHGYTLQRSRARVPFHDLDEKIARHRREERDAFAAMLAAEKAKNAASAQPTEKVEEKPRNLADLLTRNLRNED
jgi:hypothetical protein